MNKAVLFLILLTSTICYNQNRVDDELPVIFKTNKGILKSAIGWKKNQYGNWTSAKNKIPFDIEQEYKNLQNFESYGLGHYEQNFISYELRDVKIKDSLYIILIQKYRDGYYKYESINQGWTSHNSYKYYLINPSEFDKIKGIKEDSINSFKIKTKFSNDIKYVNLLNVNELTIAKDLNSVIKEKSILNSDRELFFTIRRFKNKNIIQFMFSEIYYDFVEDMYYETDLESFNKLLKTN